MFALIGLYIVFALAFTISKGVLNYTYPIFFVGFRMTLAGLLLLGYYILCKKKAVVIEKKHLWILVQIAFFHVFVTYAFEFWALEYVSAAKDALFYNLAPFITALLSLVLCNERLTIKQWFGLAIGFFGFLPMLMAQAPLETLALESFSISWPELLLIGSVSASSYGWILMQRLVHVYHPVLVNGITMLWGGLFSLIIAWMVEPVFLKWVSGPPFNTHDMLMFTWYLLILILLTNVICYNLYGTLLRKYSATSIALAGSTTPIFTALFDWILLGDKVTWHFVATVILVFLGLLIFYYDEFRRPKPTPPAI